MSDRTGPVACSAQKSEPSLVSSSTSTDHNHHGHPETGDEFSKANVGCLKSYSVETSTGQCHPMSLTAEEGDRSKVGSLKPNTVETNTDHNRHGRTSVTGDNSGKAKVGSLKSYTVEEYNEQCNGCLNVETDSTYSEINVHNQNVLKCADDVYVHQTNTTSLCNANSQSVLNNPKSCLEKVNGLTHTVAEHSSSDRFVVNLLNTYTSDTETEGHIACKLDSSLVAELVHKVRQADFVDSDDEVGAVTMRDCSSEVHCGYVDSLATELGKTSLCDHCDSSEHLTASTDVMNRVAYVVYESEKQMPDIMRLITKDLSEPYSIYTYRYFIHNWPKLCILAMVGDTCVGAIVCKLDLHKKMVRRGYIAMLAVDSEYRRRQIGSTLVTKAIEAMMRDDCDEVVLETEITNEGALRLYENLGFVRDKRLFRYYLNGVDALRLKLWLR